MRTTLDIDDDVLDASKEIARREGVSAGRAVSDLLRRALTQPAPAHAVSEAPASYGFVPFASRGGVATNAQVDALRAADGV